MASPNAGLDRHKGRVLTQMDKSNAMTTQTATESPNSKNKLLWIIIALLVLILAAAGAGGAWYFMSGGAPAADEAQEQESESAPPPQPVFVELKPFTVNIDEISDRILYIGITLKVAGEEAASRIESNMPEVRSRILMVLTSQQGDELNTSEGKRALSQELVAALEDPLDNENEGSGVSDVLFTDFIVQ